MPTTPSSIGFFFSKRNASPDSCLKYLQHVPCRAANNPAVEIMVSSSSLTCNPLPPHPVLLHIPVLKEKSLTCEDLPGYETWAEGKNIGVLIWARGAGYKARIRPCNWGCELIRGCWELSLGPLSPTLENCLWLLSAFSAVETEKSLTELLCPPKTKILSVQFFLF